MSEKNADKLKDSQYDGIQEYDNDLPRWWVVTFIACVIFSVGYWIYYHNFHGPTQIDRYEKNLATHQKKYERKDDLDITNESILAMVQNSQDMEAGQALYAANCVACHGANLGGGIGPNLTDAYSIHGNQPLDIHRTIKEGVVEKGMLAWQGILTGKQMQQVTAYLLDHINTNIDGGKEAQGDLAE